MKIQIHRGANEIGGSCVEFEYEGARIALDIGLPLDGDANDKALCPKIMGTDLQAILISHPHIDHYGLLHQLPAGVPIAMGAAAKRIVKTAAPFTGQPLPSLDGPELRDRETFCVGPFQITPYLVDHSAFDAYSLLIEAGGKRVFYSGDFRAHGRKSKLFDQIVSDPPPNIDVLLMEGSSLSRLDDQDRFPSEGELENDLVDRLENHSGLAMVHTSAQNIDRIVTLYRAAKRTGRTLVLDLYSAAILAATGHGSIPQSNWPQIRLFVPEAQRRQIKKNAWFDLLRDHSSQRIYAEELQTIAKKSIILYRPLLMPDLDKCNCLSGARFIYGQWLGYIEKGSYATTQRWLDHHSIAMEYLHTSGHASPVDLKRFAKALAPEKLVPIHSFAPNLYPMLFDNVVPHPDGVWWSA